jgi:hypothetical protein
MDETMTMAQATKVHDGLIARAVEDVLLLPIVLYTAARAAGIEQRSVMTGAQLARALTT